MRTDEGDPAPPPCVPTDSLVCGPVHAAGVWCPQPPPRCRKCVLQIPVVPYWSCMQTHVLHTPVVLKLIKAYHVCTALLQISVVLELIQTYVLQMPAVIIWIRIIEGLVVKLINTCTAYSCSTEAYTCTCTDVLQLLTVHVPLSICVHPCKRPCSGRTLYCLHIALTIKPQHNICVCGLF